MLLRPTSLLVVATLLVFSLSPANVGWADDEPSAEEPSAEKIGRAHV